MNNRGNIISARGGVLGCSFEKASQKMVFGGKRFLPVRRKKVIPIGWRFTIALTVHQEAIPNRPMTRSVWKEKDAPALEIEIVDPSDYRSDRSEKRMIYLRTVMPYAAESLNSQHQRLTAARMLSQVIEILPFMEFHVVRIYPDFRVGADISEVLRVIPSISSPEVSAPEFSGPETSNPSPSDKLDELKQLYGYPSLEEIPDHLLVYAGEDLTSSTGIDGLFRVSGESYPDLGSLGPVVAGLEAVAWLAHRSGLAGPFG